MSKVSAPPAPLRLASCTDRALSIHSVPSSSDLNNPAVVHTYSPARSVKSSSRPVLTSLSWCADGSCLASAAADSPKLILTYCKNSVFTSTELAVSQSPLTCVAFSRTTVKKILLSDTSKKVSLYDVTKKKAVKEFQCKSDVGALAVNTNDSLFCAGCVDGTLNVFNPVNNILSQPMKAEGENAVNCVEFSFTKRHLMCSAHDGGGAVVWDCNTNTSLKRFSEHAAPCTGVAFTPVNNTLVLSCG